MYNHFGPIILKQTQSILGNDVAKHYNILERLAANTITQEDMTRLDALFSDLYKAGYVACANDYKEKMKEFGVEVKINSK